MESPGSKSSPKKSSKKRKALKIVACVLGSLVLFLWVFGWILSHTCEITQHNIHGATGNSVFLHIDGHQEAVYDPSGNLVRDPANMASYNYFHPHKQPYRHFVADTLPWIVWGNTEDDPTSVSERFRAWLTDVKNGAGTAIVGLWRAHDGQKPAAKTDAQR